MTEYDFIVIGAGSAGCAVAARLAERLPERTVLLLEAGGSDRKLAVQAPLAYGSQIGGSTDWGFVAEPEPNLMDRRRWIRGNVCVTGHPAGTAAMGPGDDSVLDEKLRVRGVSGLRVADASALPRIPRANTNAPAIMIGERCAEFIEQTA